MSKNNRTTMLKWLVLICLLTYVTVMAAWAIDCHSTAKCVGIEVVIDNHTFMGDTITRKGVITELARFDSKLIGKRLDKINTRAIEKFLRSFNNFEDVECHTTTGGKLRIIVTPVIPELRVFDGDQSYYVNKDGKQIKADAKFFCNVPIVSGHFTERFPATTLLPLIRRIERDSVFRHLVMMVKADSPNDIMLVPRVAGHIINLGNLDNLDKKLHNVMLAYREIMPYQGWEKYDTISVKYDNRIVASRRDKTRVNHTPDFEMSVDFDEDAAAHISEGTEQAAAEMTAAVAKTQTKTQSKTTAQKGTATKVSPARQENTGTQETKKADTGPDSPEKPTNQTTN